MNKDEEIRSVIMATERDVAACRDSLWGVSVFLTLRREEIEQMTQDEKNCIGALRRQAARLRSSMDEMLDSIDDLVNA